MSEPTDIARKWLLRRHDANDMTLRECVQSAIDEATAELREQLDAKRIKCMELDRALEAMHARAEKAESELKEWEAERAYRGD
jgi:uncharacterized protein YhaN